MWVRVPRPHIPFSFGGITHTEIHRMSASCSVTVSDRVRRETMMIPHCPKMDRRCSPPPRSNPSIPRLSLLPGPEQITTAGPQAGRGTNPWGASHHGEALAEGVWAQWGWYPTGLWVAVSHSVLALKGRGIRGHCLFLSGRTALVTVDFQSRLRNGAQSHTMLKSAGRQPFVVLFGQASVCGGLVIWTLEQRGLRQVSTTTTAQPVFDLM